MQDTLIKPGSMDQYPTYKSSSVNMIFLFKKIHCLAYALSPVCFFAFFAFCFFFLSFFFSPVIPPLTTSVYLAQKSSISLAETTVVIFTFFFLSELPSVALNRSECVVLVLISCKVSFNVDVGTAEPVTSSLIESQEMLVL